MSSALAGTVASTDSQRMWLFEACRPRRCTVDQDGQRKTMSENALMKKQLAQRLSKKRKSCVESTQTASQSKSSADPKVEPDQNSNVTESMNHGSTPLTTAEPTKKVSRKGRKRKALEEDGIVDATPEKHPINEDVLVHVTEVSHESKYAEEESEDVVENSNETPADIDLVTSTNQIKKKPRRKSSIASSYTKRRVKRNKNGSQEQPKIAAKRALIFGESPMATKPGQEPLKKVKNTSFSDGALIWGKLKGFDWWPGSILSNKYIAFKQAEPGCVWVKWYGDNKHSMLSVETGDVVAYEEFQDKYNPAKMRGLYKRAVLASLRVAATRCKKTFSRDDVVKPQASDSGYEDVDAELTEEETNELLVQWALDNFSPTGPEGFLPQPEIPETSTSNDVEETTTESDEKASSDTEVKMASPKSRFNQPCSTPSLAEDVKALFDEVRIGTRDIESLCLACGVLKIKTQHPLFEGGLCKECKGTFLECSYLFDEDGYQMYCSICGDGKEVLMCDAPGCFRAYCNLCIDMLCGSGTVLKITSQAEWKCHMCTGKRQGLLKRRDDWQQKLHQLFMDDRDVDYDVVTLYPPISPEQRRPLRVLGLFDGIATGLQALKELEVDIEVYMAAEIDKDAIQVSSVNHDGIKHVGDVLNITESKIQEWGPFDLVIGGSPCNDLSIANPLRRGIYEGTGRLFFEFFRILSYAKPKDPKERPFFWFYENVVGMRHIDKKTISRFLQCNPVVIDAKDISPAHRARYFWGNLPGMNRPASSVPGDCLSLQECLEPNTGRKARFTKIQTVTTNGHSMKQTKKQIYPVEVTAYDGETSEDVLWCTEMERLFGFPSHYTDVGNMGRTNRQRLLGSAWSVPVVRHLLSPLRDYFKCSRS